MIMNKRRTKVIAIIALLFTIIFTSCEDNIVGKWRECEITNESSGYNIKIISDYDLEDNGSYQAFHNTYIGMEGSKYDYIGSVKESGEWKRTDGKLIRSSTDGDVTEWNIEKESDNKIEFKGRVSKIVWERLK